MNFTYPISATTPQLLIVLDTQLSCKYNNNKKDNYYYYYYYYYFDDRKHLWIVYIKLKGQYNNIFAIHWKIILSKFNTHWSVQKLNPDNINMYKGEHIYINNNHKANNNINRTVISGAIKIHLILFISILWLFILYNLEPFSPTARQSTTQINICRGAGKGDKKVTTKMAGGKKHFRTHSHHRVCICT